MATATAPSAAPASSSVQIRKRPGGPFRWIRSRIIPIIGVGVLFYMFLPIFVVVVMSFNDPAGRYNYTWNHFSTDAWTNFCGVAGMCDSLYLSLFIGVVATIGSVILGTGASLGSNGGTITLTGTGTASTALEAVQASEAFITSGGGAITLNGTHASVNRRGVYLDRTSINSGAGAITIGSTTSNIKLAGSTVSSTGGNINISTAGAHNYSALEIVEYAGTPAVPSRVSTTGSGNITLSGELTNYGGSAHREHRPRREGGRS